MYRYRCVDLEIYHIIPRITDWSNHMGLFPQKSPVGFQLCPPFFWQSTQTDIHNTPAYKVSHIHTLALSKKNTAYFLVSVSLSLSLCTRTRMNRERKTHTHTHAHTHTHTHTQTNTNIYIYTYIWKYLFVYIQVYPHKCIFIDICRYTHIFTCIDIDV